MKKIFIFTISCIMATMFTACFNDTDLEQEVGNTYIEVSQEIINFSNTQEDKEIVIKTNASSWRATKLKESDWLKLVSNSSSLIVIADKNETSNKREAKILIEAKGVTKEILVRQNTTDGYIEVSETNLNVESQGGEFLLNILKSNVEWKVEGTELYPWIFVAKGNNTIQVKVEPNTNTEKRVGKLYISSSSISPIEVVVAQEGKDLYVLPYLPLKDITKAEVLEDARKRGMFYIKNRPNRDYSGTIYDFDAGDAFNSEASYEFKHGADRYTNFSLYTRNNEYGTSGEFHDFLVSKDFAFIQEKLVGTIIEKKYEYITPFYKIALFVRVNPTLKSTELIFVLLEVQPGPLKTFDEFPYRNIELLNTADFFAVKKWEEGDGGCIETSRSRGEKNPNIIANGQFFSVTNENTHSSSIYFFEEKLEPYIGKLFQKVDIYTEVSLGLWMNSEGRAFVTNEMEEKLREEGFEYQGRPITGENQEWISYFDPNRKLALLLTLLVEPSGEHYLCISYYALTESDTNNARKEIALKNAANFLSERK